MVVCLLAASPDHTHGLTPENMPDSQELVWGSFCSRALDVTASAEMKINEFRFQEAVFFYLWSDCFWQLRVTAAPGEIIFGKPHSRMPLFCCVCVSVCVDSACMPCCISAFISQLVLFILLHVSLVMFPAHNQSADHTWPSLFNCSPVIVCYFEEWSPASRLSVECVWVTSTPVILGQAELYGCLRKHTHTRVRNGPTTEQAQIRLNKNVMLSKNYNPLIFYAFFENLKMWNRWNISFKISEKMKYMCMHL